MAVDPPVDDVPSPPSESPTQRLPKIGEHGLLHPGKVLGGRYEIRSYLGGGGMGEVWQAFDLKLRVQVALKALRAERFAREGAIELLRREVRSARDVLSPNVCRIFDLIEVNGTELVSMEYVDGVTLLALLQERGPLELDEAQDIASQFLAGLEAIHQAGLVHRDIKPENIMITRSGRVVVMDFGLARCATEGRGTVAGTPAYMAPEQTMGRAVDARADVYAAGIVLAEMVHPGGIKDFESRESVWGNMHCEPPQVPDMPWAPVLRMAVAKEPDHRYPSAHTLIRALEEVTLRVKGAEELHPYPGLASFTEQDTEYFFGREAEVEHLWQKLDRPHLLAIVGPSGAGKTSFLRAGLVPTADTGWGILRCTPGNTPFVSLGQVLARAMAGDADAVTLLVQADNPDALCQVVQRWRRRHENALLILDQFEELFTLNAPAEQARFADLVGRLALDADVFVLLSIRDDFLIRCREHEALSPIFSGLTALLPPAGEALRRALVHPATKCGYRFEDDALVDEMLAEVEGGRGALPLLAFAMSRLWEKRDREQGILTRRTYREIGGVGGALAQHAEATMARIGAERAPVVRELFRNLVTAERTRAVRTVDDTLSVFPESDRRAAAEVLGELIDARLLTSYEVRSEGEAPCRRVEIIHESLLEKWPRLQGWQTQDADAARLRDELRQAAVGWDEHGRPKDRLWTDSTFREFELWRERYPGGLSEVERAFAAAMTALASRRRRRRRLATAVAFVVVIAIAAALGTLWQSSVRESRRAEAQKLVAMGRAELGTYPTASLAYARASLELFDTAEARRLVVESLWRGGAQRLLDTEALPRSLSFSPDGAWLAMVDTSSQILVYGQRGGPPAVIEAKPGRWLGVAFDAQGSTLAIRSGDNRSLSLFSVGDWEPVRTFETDAVGSFVMSEDEVLTLHRNPEDLPQWIITGWPRGAGEPSLFGTTRTPLRQGLDLDPAGRRVITFRSGELIVRPLDTGTEEELVVGRHPGNVDWFQWARGMRDRIVARDRQDGTAHIRVWSLEAGLERVLPVPDDALDLRAVALDDSGRWLALSTDGPIYLWGLDGPPDAQPRRILTKSGGNLSFCLAIDPQGRWLTAGRKGVVRFSPLAWPSVHVLPFTEGKVWTVYFTPDSKRLLVRTDRHLAVMPLASGLGERSVVDCGGSGFQLGISPDGRLVATTARKPGGNSVILVPMDGSTLGEPEEVLPRAGVDRWTVAIDSSGRYVATATHYAVKPQDQVLEILDLETGEVMTHSLLDPDHLGSYEPTDGGIVNMLFLPDGRLLSGGDGGIRRWDIHSGTSEILIPTSPKRRLNLLLGVTRDGRACVGTYSPNGEYELEVILDLETGHTQPADPFTGADGYLNWTGRVLITNWPDGTVKVGSLGGGEPHLLFGHEGVLPTSTDSYDGRLMASATNHEIRVWSMPDMSRPPLQALPYDELMAKLDTYTNLRAERDEASPSGWDLTIGPFQGWKDVPAW